MTNEGEDTISTCAHVKEPGTPIYFDLWSCECYAQPGDIHFTLARRQSLLILLDKDRAFCAPMKHEKTLIEPHFTLVEQGDNRKTYEAVYTPENPLGTETFTVNGEEMVECYLDDALVGVSFWNPHTFEVGFFLKHGENRIRLVFTGSAANRYATEAVCYGLKET